MKVEQVDATVADEMEFQSSLEIGKLGEANAALHEAVNDAVAVYVIKDRDDLKSTVFMFNVANTAMVTYSLGYFIKNGRKIVERAKQGKFTRANLVTRI